MHTPLPARPISSREGKASPEANGPTDMGSGPGTSPAGGTLMSWGWVAGEKKVVPGNLARPARFPPGTSALGFPKFPTGTDSWLSRPYPQVPRVALRL